MRGNHIQNIFVHNDAAANVGSLRGKVNEFHVEVIERSLKQSDLTTKQKIAVIDKIIEALRSREADGIIR